MLLQESNLIQIESGHRDIVVPLSTQQAITHGIPEWDISYPNESENDFNYMFHVKGAIPIIISDHDKYLVLYFPNGDTQCFRNKTPIKLSEVPIDIDHFKLYFKSIYKTEIAEAKSLMKKSSNELVRMCIDDFRMVSILPMREDVLLDLAKHDIHLLDHINVNGDIPASLITEVINQEPSIFLSWCDHGLRSYSVDHMKLFFKNATEDQAQHFIKLESQPVTLKDALIVAVQKFGHSMLVLFMDKTHEVPDERTLLEMIKIDQQCFVWLLHYDIPLSKKIVQDALNLYPELQEYVDAKL